MDALSGPPAPCAAGDAVNQASPLNFLEAAGGFHKSAVIRAAVELDVCTGIAAGLDTAGLLAAARHCSEKGMRVLLDALTILDLLKKSDGRYELSSEAAQYLDRASADYAGEALRFLMSGFMDLAFSRFTDAVRLGGSAVGPAGSMEPDHPVWVEYARGMMPLARTTAELVGERAAGSKRILDIAAGHGLYGIETLKRSPEGVALAVDWSGVLEVARENAVKAGVASRWMALEGSAFEVDWGDGFDCVILANFLHHFSRSVAVEFLKRVRGAMVDGGKLVVVALAPGETRVRPSAPGWFAVMVLATTAEGEAYTLGEYDSMLEEAGFGAAERYTAAASARTVMVALR